MKIHESAENYLEAILILGLEGGRVRSIDIAAYMGYSKASVSVAMKKLRQDNLIKTGPDGIITLTAEGRKIAESMYERHMLISNWLESLGVDKQTAAADACRMEHVISESSFAAIKRHILSAEVRDKR